MVPATALVQNHCVLRWFPVCHSGLRPLPGTHACALCSGTVAARRLVPGAEGRFGQSLPSGSGFPEAAEKPVAIYVHSGEPGTLWDPKVSTVLDDFVNGLLPSAWSVWGGLLSAVHCG